GGGGLAGGPQPVIADLAGRDALGVRQQLRDRKAAEAALARAHAAAQVGLELVGADALERRGVAHLARRHLFAATYQRFAAWQPKAWGWAEQPVEEAPAHLRPAEGTGMRRRHPVPHRLVDAPQLEGGTQRGKAPALLRRQGARDAGAVARDRHNRDRAPTPLLERRHEAELRLVPGVLATHGEREVD